VVVDKRLFFT